MNWFKIAKDFTGRNLINSKIRYLIKTKKNLKYLSKLIFQSGKNAKEANFKIINSSKITSYPIVHDILIEADELALDSPWRFAELCNEAIGRIDDLMGKFKKKREEIVYDKKNNPKKGWK